MIKRICFWLNCSRAFALPVTILSWLVVFVFALKSGGNLINGMLALIGISFAHLAGNMADDYIDYGILSKDEKLMNSAVATKCCYLRDGSITLSDLGRMIAVFSIVALIIGAFLYYRSGVGVIWLTVIGGILTLTYAKFSLVGLSEVIIGLLFGPLMFEGVWYVMKKSFSMEVFVLSLAVVMLSISFLYIHTLLDFDSDTISHKKTLCCRINDKNKALKLYGVFVGACYISALVFGFMTLNVFVLITFAVLPFAVKIYSLTKKYNSGEDTSTENFYFVLFKARNLMIYFSLLMTLAILFG